MGQRGALAYHGTTAPHLRIGTEGHDEPRLDPPGPQGRSGRISQTVGELIASGRTVITLDLTALSFLDSAGHVSIGAVADLAEGLGGEVRLDGCSRPVRRFLDLTSSILASAPRDGPTARLDQNGAGNALPREVGF